MWCGQNQTQSAGEQSDSGDADGILDHCHRDQAFDSAQLELFALAPGVDVHGGDDEECRCKTDSVKHDEFGNFSRRANLTVQIAAPIAGDSPKQEFQRLDVKETAEMT